MVVGPNKNEVDGQPTKASLDLYNRNLTWVFTTESHSFFPNSQKGPCNNAAYYRSSSKPSPKGFEVIMKVSVHWGKWKYPGFSGIPKHYSEMILILRNPKCHCRPLVKIWAYSGQRMRRVAQSPLIMICDSRIHQKWYLGGLVSHMGGNPWYNDKFGKKKKKGQTITTMAEIVYMSGQGPNANSKNENTCVELMRSSVISVCSAFLNSSNSPKCYFCFFCKRYFFLF